MSNKLFSMLELSSKGFPHNEFYALDLNSVPVNEIEAFLQDGLRNFRARVNCRSMLVRTGLATRPEVKLYIATDLDSSDDELIITKMKEALAFFSTKFGGYSNGFIILQQWTPEEDYRYSLNLMPVGDEYIIEAINSNHYNLDRAEHRPTVIKLSPKGNTILRQGLRPDELLDLKRQLNQLLNNFFFEENSVYEFSFLANKPSFYQIKKPGHLLKNPISKEAFYKKLRDNNISFKKRIMRSRYT